MTAQTGMPIAGKMYIGGQWTSGRAMRGIAVHSPATEELVGSVPEGTIGDAEDALKAARLAQPRLGSPAADRARHTVAAAVRAARPRPRSANST